MVIRVPRFSGKNLRLTLLKTNGAAVRKGDEICRIDFESLGAMGEADVTLESVSDGVIQWIVDGNSIVEFGQELGNVEPDA